MTDYRTLDNLDKVSVDLTIKKLVPNKIKTTSSGWSYNEQEQMLHDVHCGDYCSECLMVYYNCLCSHDN